MTATSLASTALVRLRSTSSARAAGSWDDRHPSPRYRQVEEEARPAVWLVPLCPKREGPFLGTHTVEIPKLPSHVRV